VNSDRKGDEYSTALGAHLEDEPVLREQRQGRDVLARPLA
jgi:hypothetical protein